MYAFCTISLFFSIFQPIGGEYTSLMIQGSRVIGHVTFNTNES